MNKEEQKVFETLKKGYGLTKAETEIISNLIEKQQKEIEELKKKKYILNAETGEVKEIPISDNYISKDKIREKIKELDILYNVNLKPMTDYELYYFMQSYIDKFKNILNELLEE